MNTSLSLPVQDTSQAGEARRIAAQWARDAGCDEEVLGRLALVVTELGRNLAIHTAGGKLLLRRLSQQSNWGVEVLSLDKGPGMANFNECLRDGFSTAGTSGTGLGAVQRTSQVFAVHSQPGTGTALLSELWQRPSDSRNQPPAWETGGASVAMGREPVCGDSWAELHPRPGVMRILVADGLGHGEYAAEASMKAVEIFLKNPLLDLPFLLEIMHGALKTTRGAAVAVAELDLVKAMVSFVGVGNISATIVTDVDSTSLVSLNGTIGAQSRGFRLFSYPLTEGAALVMSSDGVKNHWRMNQYPGLIRQPPGLIAGVLYRDQARETDDATLVVIRKK